MAAKKPRKVLAWHWLQNDRHMQYDKAGVGVKAGEVYEAAGPLGLCCNGMHASVGALDSLAYAPGSIICRVELSGEILTGDDKVCARSRRVLWMADADRTLHWFAVWCAERAVKAANVTDPRSLKAIEVKKLWLDGKATDAELAAASAAAWAAASAAAWATAWAATRAAAWAAASAAASAAACAAAWAAARAAARDAERKAQDAQLHKMLLSLKSKREMKAKVAA